MVKKEIIVEELASDSDQEFDGKFSDDDNDDSQPDDAPIPVSKKEAMLRFEKSLP